MIDDTLKQTFEMYGHSGQPSRDDRPCAGSNRSEFLL